MKRRLENRGKVSNVYVFSASAETGLFQICFTTVAQLASLVLTLLFDQSCQSVSSGSTRWSQLSCKSCRFETRRGKYNQLSPELLDQNTFTCEKLSRNHKPNDYTWLIYILKYSHQFILWYFLIFRAGCWYSWFQVQDLFNSASFVIDWLRCIMKQKTIKLKAIKSVNSRGFKQEQSNMEIKLKIKLQH